MVAQTINGQLVELIKAGDAIKIPLFSNASFLVETESNKIKTANGVMVAGKN